MPIWKLVATATCVSMLATGAYAQSSYQYQNGQNNEAIAEQPAGPR